MNKILMTTAVGTALLFATMSANACPNCDKDKPLPPPHYNKMHKFK